MQLRVSCRLVCIVKICLKYSSCNSSTADNILSYLFLKTNAKLWFWQMLVWQTADSGALYFSYCQWVGKAVNVILVLDPLVFLRVFWGLAVVTGSFTWRKIHSSLGCSKLLEQVVCVASSVCMLKLSVSKTYHKVRIECLLKNACSSDWSLT